MKLSVGDISFASECVLITVHFNHKVLSFLGRIASRDGSA